MFIVKPAIVYNTVYDQLDYNIDQLDNFRNSGLYKWPIELQQSKFHRFVIKVK